MISEGTEADKVSAEQIQQVAADVELFLRAHKISRKQLATAVGYSPGVMSDFLAGKYAGNQGQVAIDLENWLVEEEQRRAQPATTQFVWTNVAMEIKGTANYCLDKRTIGLVYGPDTSGIGKTTALIAIHQELGPRRSSLLTIDKVDANPTGLLKKLCASMRLDDGGTNRHRYQAIVGKLSGRSHLLLIDQIHNLRGAKDDKPFYILADIYDATKTAQLWCGTADLVTYLERQQRRNADESLAQICRRVFPRVDLMAGIRHGGGGDGDLLVTVEQVREMFARNKLKLTAAGARWICNFCNTPDSGCVGVCARVFEYALMMAEMQRATSIDVPLLQAALKRGLTLVRAEALTHRMDVEQPRAAMKVG